MDIITNLKEIRQKAKKEVFDDIEKDYWDFGFPNQEANAELKDMVDKLKTKHLTNNSNKLKDVNKNAKRH